MRVLRLPAAALFLVAACKTLPHDEVPEAEIQAPESWSALVDSDSRGPVSVQPWWRSFGDEPMAQAVDEALASNLDLRTTAARIAAAAAQARIVGSDRFPNVDLGATVDRRKQVFVGLPIPGGGVSSSTSTSYAFDFGVSWEVDLWGRIAAETHAAEADQFATVNDHEAARHSVAAQMAKAWFAWQEAQLQADLAQRTADAFGRTLRVTRSRFESGLGGLSGVRLVEADLAAAESLREASLNAVDGTARQLEVLLGRYPSGELTGGSGLPLLPEMPLVGAPSELVARRPDLRAAEARLMAADERLYGSRALLYPRVTLSASGGRNSDDLDDLGDSDFDIWSLGAGLVQPIFEGGRLRAGVDLSDARLQESLSSFESALLRAYSEVETSLRAEYRLARRARFQRLASETAAEARRLAEERYASGLEDLLQVLIAERRALETESMWIAVRLERLVNRVDLHLALGGGFDENEVQP